MIFLFQSFFSNLTKKKCSLTNAVSASGPETFMFPSAGAGELVEDKAGGAVPEHIHAAGTLVVLVADRGVFVLEVAVLPGALHAVRLGLFCRTERMGC